MSSWFCCGRWIARADLCPSCGFPGPDCSHAYKRLRGGAEGRENPWVKLGADHPHAKLTWEQVNELRDLAADAGLSRRSPVKELKGWLEKYEFPETWDVSVHTLVSVLQHRSYRTPSTKGTA